jgi:hypothetical protein
VLLGVLDADPTLIAEGRGQTVIADKNYYGREFEITLADAGLTLLRPARHGEPPRVGVTLFKPLRQVIESINDTFKGQLDLDATGASSGTAGQTGGRSRPPSADQDKSRPYRPNQDRR